MTRMFASSASGVRADKATQFALSLIFGLAAAFSINNVALSAQTFAQEPQNNGSANADDSTQNNGSNNNDDSAANNDAPALEPIRLVRNADGVPMSLETSVVRYSGQYTDSEGQTRDVSVDLIGAVHIAEKGYYDEINELFKEYETVVFELVSDTDDMKALMEDAKKKKQEKRSWNPLNIISYLQEDSAKFLKLTHQMDGIDYLAENLKRGDCGALEFIQWTIQNGDVVNFVLDAVAQGFLESAPGSGEGMAVALLCAKDGRLVARRLFAIELADTSITDLEKEVRSLKKSDPDKKQRESAIIHLRNKKAIAVVQKELDAGRERVALFFGAAHLPDLGDRLEKDFGLKLQPETRWFKAWNLEKIEE